jgi:hypothetical protein
MNIIERLKMILVHDVDYHLIAQKPYLLQRLACQDGWISRILHEPWSRVYCADAKNEQADYQEV